MILPRIIEHIGSLFRSDGSRITHFGLTQVRTELVLPNSELSFNLRPTGGVFADIAYAVWLGHDIVPEVFNITFGSPSGAIFSGLVTQTAIDEGVAGFIPFTKQAAGSAKVVNRTNLVQRFEMDVQYIIIYSEADYFYVIDRIKDLGQEGRISYQKMLLAVDERLLPPARR